MKKIINFYYKILVLSIISIYFCLNVQANSFQSGNYTGERYVYYAPADTGKTITKRDIRKNLPKKKGKRGKISFDTFDSYYSRAMKAYSNRTYLTAAKYFEELYPLSIGTPYGDTILFLFADCYFQNKDYQLAAFHFRDYARRYPGTERAQQASLNSLRAFYYISPEYYLDQSGTTFAIEEINNFIQMYPTSPHVEECNEMLDNLRDKLARKDFEIVKLYYNTGNYKSVQVAIRNFLKTFPYSKYSAEAAYILVKNNYDYAKKSVDSKKKERFLACLDAYELLKNRFSSEYMKYSDAKKIMEDAQNQIDKINLKNKK